MFKRFRIQGLGCSRVKALLGGSVLRFKGEIV